VFIVKEQVTKQYDNANPNNLILFIWPVYNLNTFNRPGHTTIGQDCTTYQFDIIYQKNEVLST